MVNHNSYQKTENQEVYSDSYYECFAKSHPKNIKQNLKYPKKILPQILSGQPQKKSSQGGSCLFS